MTVAQNTVYASQATAFVYLNSSNSVSYASFNTLYKSMSIFLSGNLKKKMISADENTTTDTFSSGSLVGENGIMAFFSTFFANTAGSGKDAVKLSSGSVTSFGYNIYVSYSGVSAGTNDTGFYSFYFCTSSLY